MSSSTDTQHTFDNPNFVAHDPLPRDQEQSHRLHQPDHLINTIDPITGHDIVDLSGHPSIVDGNVTIYFESEKTRKIYEEMQVDHPFSGSLGKPSEDMDRGG